MRATRDGRSILIEDLPGDCPDKTPNPVRVRLTVQVSYADIPEEGSPSARGIALDNIVIPRMVAGLNNNAAKFIDGFLDALCKDSAEVKSALSPDAFKILCEFVSESWSERAGEIFKGFFSLGKDGLYRPDWPK